VVHSVVSTADSAHKLNTAAEPLHGKEKVDYGDSGHLDIEKREGSKKVRANSRSA